jgi:hypothetical protein
MEPDIYTRLVHQEHLVPLTFLNPKMDAAVLGIMRTIPKDLLGSLVLSIAVNTTVSNKGGNSDPSKARNGSDIELHFEYVEIADEIILTIF